MSHNLANMTEEQADLQKKHLVECLARFVCRLPNKGRRATFMMNWEKNHGPDSAAALKRVVEAEWGKFKQLRETEQHAQQVKDEAVSMKRLAAEPEVQDSIDAFLESLS